MKIGCTTSQRRLFNGLVLVLVTLTTIETNAQRRYILWNGEKQCGQRGSGIAKDEAIECISVDTPRGKVSAVIHDEISVAVAIAEDGKNYILSTQIRNDSPTTIEFDTDIWGAAHFTQAKNGNDRKLISAETAIPSRDLLKKITTAANQETEIDTYMADVARTTEVREQRRSDGTRYRTTVITPDQDAKRIANDRGEARQAIASDERSRIRSSAITQKWLKSGASVKGLVYFRRVKKAGLVIFSLKVSGTTYIFRFQTDQSSNSPKSLRNR